LDIIGDYGWSYVTDSGGTQYPYGQGTRQSFLGYIDFFIVGAIGMFAYVAVNREALVLSSVKSAPAHLWVAGLLGAFM
jgi:uncharacterized membrane protein YdcZ (DUF606 family)